MACAAANAAFGIDLRKAAVFSANNLTRAFHDANAAFDAGVFVDSGQADLCFLLFCQRNFFNGSRWTDSRTIMTVIVAKTLGVVNMYGRIIR